MKRLSKILPHITIILAGMFIVFWILDILNPTMNFINRKISNKLLLAFCISAIITAYLRSTISARATEKNRTNAESHGSAFFYGQIFLKNICIVPDRKVIIILSRRHKMLLFNRSVRCSTIKLR